MKQLIFKQVTIVSDSLRCGGQFELSPTLNLITGNDNSIGKSTLAKIFLWALGCDPHFDTTWINFDVKVLVKFKVGDLEYSTARQGNQMWLGSPNGSWQAFPKITGEYASKFAKIVEFSALLPSRDDASSLEVPPPAFFFLPFYLDQRESWSKAWASFSGLLQYSNWQRTIIGCHTGYLSDTHFLIEKQISSRIDTKRDAAQTVSRIDTAISIMNELAPPPNRLTAITPAEIDSITTNITSSLSSLQGEQEILFSSLSKLQIEKEHTASQLKLATAAIASLHSDYLFSVENIQGNVLNCPICGTEHDNSLVSRSSILADKDNAVELAKNLTASLSKVEQKLEETKSKLQVTKSKINEIEEMVGSRLASDGDGDGDNQNETSFIEGLASLAIQKRVTQTRDQQAVIIKDIERENRALKKQQKELLSKEDRESMNEDFLFNLRMYIGKLKADGVNLSGVKSPADYKKLYGSGGAAESVRGLLAYYLAVLHQIYRFKKVAAPVIIDTPNQHEQVNQSYADILEILKSDIAKKSQVVLCAMDRPELAQFKANANIITLTDGKLITREGYTKYRNNLRFLDNIN